MNPNQYNGTLVRKDNPTLSDVHVNAPLGNVSIAYMQDAIGFVAGQVFKVVPSDKQSNLYYKYDRSYWNRSETKKRAPLAESAGGDYGITTDSFLCDVYGIHKDIPDQLRGNADAPIQLDSEATNWVTLQMLLQREIAWAGNYFKAGVWANDYTGAAATANPDQVATFLQWSDANSTPIEDVRFACTAVQESTGFRPNQLTMGRRVYDKLLDHPDFIDRVKYGQTGPGAAMVNKQIMAQLFDVGEVFVMEAIQNTAKEGQTAAHSFIGGKHAMLTYSPPSAGLMTPSAGYTFAWTGYLGASEASQGSRIAKFRRQPEVKADRVEGEMAYQQKLVANDLGSFFAGIVA